MSDEVLRRHVDMGAANRDRLIEAQQLAGIPYTNVTHNTTNNYDQSTHNTINQPVSYTHLTLPTIYSV